MTKARDTQRGKLYAAERRAFGNGNEGLTVSECQALIDKWAQSKVLRRRYPRAAERVEVRDGRGHRWAVYYESYAVQEAGFFTGWRPVIHLPKWGRSRWVLAHEYAHHLTHDTGAAHGWEYAECYLYLVRVTIGRGMEERLKAEMKVGKVRWRPKATRTMTDAQRQAARERLAAINDRKADELLAGIEAEGRPYSY